MKLYVRNKTAGWITFLHDVAELKDFVDSYLPGRYLIIGDLSTFSITMRNILLKFLEENPIVDVYSSSDITDPILLSRFMSIVKDPIQYSTGSSIEDYQQSDKSYLSAVTCLSHLSSVRKIRIPTVKPQVFKLLVG